MSDIVLKVENLYKRYRLGNVDRTAFKEDIVSFFAKLQGKPDPYESYITSNELAAVKDINEVKSRYVWSLQDINFEVKRGEILGIIGKNGAGKSTLLKILSKTTAPTKGNIKIKGRIASLLEVGTGFHPELTGRENIYMNGAILGMRKHEITRKLDEIIAFAGVEAYIDTPVKRYSSGMYVRLAFAVAAHLEPDILIVDEVLAVGDAEFQKKCIGKMKDVSQGEGRTVLFVSHNIAAVKQLCTKGILLKNGNMEVYGDIGSVISEYMKKNASMSISGEIPSDALRSGLGEAKYLRLQLIDKNGEPIKHLFFKQKMQLRATLQVYEHIPRALLGICITTGEGEKLSLMTNDNNILTFDKGEYQIDIEIPNIFLEGNYSFNISISHFPSGSDIDYLENVYNFTIDKIGEVGETDFRWTKHGHISQEANFQIKTI